MFKIWNNVLTNIESDKSIEQYNFYKENSGQQEECPVIMRRLDYMWIEFIMYYNSSNRVWTFEMLKKCNCQKALDK